MPLRVVLRALLAERQGQLALDFQPGHAGSDTPRPKVLSLAARREKSEASAAAAISPGPTASCDASLDAYVGSDPQRALAAQVLHRGIATWTMGMSGSWRRRPRRTGSRWSSIRTWCRRSSTSPTSTTARDELIEAQALYERAISLDPDCFEAHFNLGNIHHDLGRYSRALLCYRVAVSLNPTYADAHFYLAVTLEKTGQSADAKPHWRHYQSLAPDGEWADLASEFSE